MKNAAWDWCILHMCMTLSWAVRLRHFRKEKGQKGVSRYLHTWRWVSKIAEDI